MIEAFAKAIFDDYVATLDAGRTHFVAIVPVGPVGQYPLLAKLCQGAGVSLRKMTLIVMDEYLTDEGAWIDDSDPLSFRGHIERNLLANLAPDDQPEVIIPDPRNPKSVQKRIEAFGGVDITYAGVGITGHLAFNEPMEGVTDAAYFATLPTRVVPLLRETRLINSVTAARGNVARIPRLAVTVGMREILSARKLHLFMNRSWQSAAIRRLAFGPVTPAFPASLVQNHADWQISAVSHVLETPEPELA
ncbi:glucosamine-6-phosphate isomerase [Actibacterium pelagium]|uniref:Glucosamine-6-phosphate isomerase n=2 Tax=Actibacterium pelagium TaxID=2029103 RepID=A0A917EHX7_9RHOB|nr:glucosamine-6-phosphate isomerase [Actibacterium pelagium]